MRKFNTLLFGTKKAQTLGFEPFECLLIKIYFW